MVVIFPASVATCIVLKWTWIFDAIWFLINKLDENTTFWGILNHNINHKTVNIQLLNENIFKLCFIWNWLLFSAVFFLFNRCRAWLLIFIFNRRFFLFLVFLWIFVWIFCLVHFCVHVMASNACKFRVDKSR